MKIKFKFLLSLLLVAVLLNGCTTFQRPKCGIWVSDELGITIFIDEPLDERGEMFMATLMVDGEAKEIVAVLSLSGAAIFYPIEYLEIEGHLNRNWSEINYFYNGGISNYINRMFFRNTMTFRPYRSDRSYTFVRQ